MSVIETIEAIRSGLMWIGLLVLGLCLVALLGCAISEKRHSCRFQWSRHARPSPEESGESAASPRPSRSVLVGIALLAIVCTLFGGGFERVVRRWVWYGAKPRETVTLSVRYRMKGDSTALKPFLPGCEFMLMGVDW